MKNQIYSLVMVLFIGISSFAQAPNWTVNENEYEYTMTFIAFLNVNGKTLTNTNDKVAAFVNDEVRGVANLSYNSNANGYFAYLTVFSNTGNETINFKIYDAESNSISNAVQSQTFSINEHYGSTFQAYSIASPALNNEAEITNFGFEGLTITSQTIANGQINIVVDQSVNITSLKANFQTSNGATLFYNSNIVASGQNTFDFSNPITFAVRSEDQSKVQNWTVTITKSSGVVTYYKKDAVCYNGGAIKVIFNKDNAVVTLYKNNAFYASQTINNGETIFRDLEPNNYTINVSGNSKQTTINQKQ
ncbi:conserved exported hypothetical protein [Tenacibaculum sp. 190524A02b]|uniref:Uncharacterized protein n=1 Tax=Tenacibaculum vairaonense TaxID=3137860 RepID=A0ABM9PH87_9FLAO